MPSKQILLASSTLALMSTSGPGHAANLIYNFELNGSFANSAGPGSVTPQGGVLGTNGYSYEANQGLTIGLGGAGLATYAIEFRGVFNGTDQFVKFVDFQNLTGGFGLYALSSKLYYSPAAIGGSDAFSYGTFATVRLERSAGGQVTGSVDGVQQFNFADPFGVAVFAPGYDINLFQADYAFGRQNAARGYVDYVRVYDAPIPPSVPEPASWALMITGFGIAGAALRLRKRVEATAA